MGGCGFTIHSRRSVCTGQCPLSGVGRCPPLRGFLSTSSMGISIGDMKLVCCREVVRFWEGPLLEVLLYWSLSFIRFFLLRREKQLIIYAILSTSQTHMAM